MSTDAPIIGYKLCVKCNRRMAKISDIYCKGCRPKKIINKDKGENLAYLFLTKFENKDPSFTQGQIADPKISDAAFHISRYRLKKEVSLPVNSHSQVRFFMLYWDQFNDFEAFSSYIVKSKQISPTYFLMNSFEIQKKPKYKYFVKSREDIIPNILPPIHNIPPIPRSRPLHLLVQKSFWDDLISLYFQHIHTRVPLFSIHSFDPETAPKTLLSAIYYGGLYCRADKPPEIIEYFENYLKQNIKEIIKVSSLENAQSSCIYAALMNLEGKLTLSRALLANAIRMSYSLGLHLNLKPLSPIKKYNRLLLFSNIRAISLGVSGVSSLALGQLTEFGQINSTTLIPHYQIPNSNCAFYFDTEDENIVYGFCCDTFTKLLDDCSQSVWSISNCHENSIEDKFDVVFDDINQKYFQSIQTLDLLLKEFPHLNSTILSHKHQLILMYHLMNLERYKILKMKVNKLKARQITNMINECTLMFESVIESESFVQHTHVYPYTAGLFLISLYSNCNVSQKSILKDKLGEIFKYLSTKFCADKLVYLIIKNEYESILKDR